MSGNTSETRCKHCQKRIAFSGNYWLQVETNGYLSGGFCLSNPNGRHEPTPPEVEAVTEQGEDYWIAACLHIVCCQRQACETCGTIIAKIDKEHSDVKAI